MKRVWVINRVLIVFFALSSGMYKMGFGEADVEIFSHLGMSGTMTALFGLTQLLAGLGCIPQRTRIAGGIALALCNTLATAALFAAGIQPFAWISWVFVGMAALLALDRN